MELSALMKSLQEAPQDASDQEIYLAVLLKDFEAHLLATGAFANDIEYLTLMELKFLLRNVRELSLQQLYSSYSKPTTTATTPIPLGVANNATQDMNGDISDVRVKSIDRKMLALRLVMTIMLRILLIDLKKDLLDNMLYELHAIIAARLNQNFTNNSIPRIVQLATLYHLSSKESDLLHLLVIIQGSTNPFVITSLIDEDYFRRNQLLLRLTHMSESQLELFCDAERLHNKEGIITSEEDHGVCYNIRVSRAAVLLLYHTKVNEEEYLKVSQTMLEQILTAETVAPTTPAVSTSEGRKRGKNDEGGRKKRRKDNSAEDAPPTEVLTAVSPLADIDSDDNTSSLGPYPSNDQLSYLEDGFAIITTMVRSNAVRLKDDMKKEGTRIPYEGGEVKQGRRELNAKLVLLQRKMDIRIEASRKSNSLPRLEELSTRLNLDHFEKLIILLLIGKTVSPVVKALMDALESSSGRAIEDVATVGQVLSILCSDVRDQIAHRKYFYRSGRLLSNGIINLSKSRWHQGSGDLTDQRAVLDRRVLDWVVGLDSEINEIVEGSDLYTPTVQLSQVVLPDGILSPILTQCRAYEGFRTYRKEKHLQDVMAYGNSLVILLCGKSGTGKTMTVNATANALGKKVLLVDFAGLSGRREGSGELDADLRGLFREAHLSNAVLFFDECEAVFRSRDRGGDRLLNTLLTEIERHEGIVFMATNRPHDIDEAMHRRITSVVQFNSPDVNMRLKIWQNLVDTTPAATTTSIAKLPVAEDVDLPAIALKYELTGGFIKNALLSALLTALDRNSSNPVLTQADLIEGCKMQMRGALNLKNFEQKAIPSTPLSSLILSPAMLATAKSIITIEASRSIIHTYISSPQPATIVALAGPSGSGKKTLINAIGCDLQKSVKVVHIGVLLGGNGGGRSGGDISDTIAAIENLVLDARLGEEIVAIDGFEHVLEDTSSEGWRLQLLLSRILATLNTFPGLVFLLCHIDNPQNMMLQRDFASKLFAFVRFTTPTADLRQELWKHMLPDTVATSDVNFHDLSRRFEFTSGGIAATIVRAIAAASSRCGTLVVTQKDFLAAGEAELQKLKGANLEFVSKMFM